MAADCCLTNVHDVVNLSFSLSLCFVLVFSRLEGEWCRGGWASAATGAAAILHHSRQKHKWHDGASQERRTPLHAFSTRHARGAQKGCNCTINSCIVYQYLYCAGSWDALERSLPQAGYRLCVIPTDTILIIPNLTLFSLLSVGIIVSSAGRSLGKEEQRSERIGPHNINPGGAGAFPGVCVVCDPHVARRRTDPVRHLFCLFRPTPMRVPTLGSDRSRAFQVWSFRQNTVNFVGLCLVRRKDCVAKQYNGTIC